MMDESGERLLPSSSASRPRVRVPEAELTGAMGSRQHADLDVDFWLTLVESAITAP